MSDQGPETSARGQPARRDPRKARLKAALQANIARRKAQASQRQAGPGDDGATAPDDADPSLPPSRKG